eukprot:CAMPEP_0183373914 /NCGR_PEP_ID=MMETSP0164_2-20130417/112879_1 /TAXON_ID=221442 /ORGANISM="Coccolithus pelagicus ssp braarudi, Strain PLY182g" /LENGTH=348 /DNA_ID=CAMNT_0025550865 /DNA_START=18 /DNA_END=1059 /DNA_ORIENTATION=-
MRSRHGDAAVTRCMLKAEAREVAELPEGFHVNEEPSTDNPPTSNHHGHWYRATVPGLSGTLHDNAVYPLHIFVDNSYPDPPSDPHDGVHHQVFVVKMLNDARFHPNVYLSGKICFHGMECVRKIWDASCSISELLLFTCASLHQMQNLDPACKAPYRAARYERPYFRRKVREMALAVQADPRLQPTPQELLKAALLPDPNSLLRPVKMASRTHRLWWQAEGKWPTYTYPDDVGANGVIKDPEGAAFWMAVNMVLCSKCCAMTNVAETFAEGRGAVEPIARAHTPSTVMLMAMHTCRSEREEMDLRLARSRDIGISDVWACFVGAMIGVVRADECASRSSVEMTVLAWL